MFANNRVHKAWTQTEDAFLWPKGQGQSIMTLDFILFYERLNLNSLTLERREEKPQTIWLLETEAINIFEYGKNIDRYWVGAKLYQ